MVIIKDVIFVDAKERMRVQQDYKSYESDYIGMVSTYACGRALNIISEKVSNYMPTWILSAICEYLEKTRKNNKTIIYQDYNFFVYLYGLNCFVEVDTKEVVKIKL